MTSPSTSTPCQDDYVSSSSIVEIGELRAKVKSIIRSLDKTSYSFSETGNQLARCRKLVKPKHCVCDRTCTCKACNDLDMCASQIQTALEKKNIGTGLNQIERMVEQFKLLYREYVAAHGQDWDL